MHELQHKLPEFVNGFGAVHFSRVFSMTSILETESDFLKQLIGANKNPAHADLIHVGQDRLTTEDWAKEFLLPLWRILHQRFHEQKTATENAISKAVARGRVAGGLGKALTSLRSVQQRSVQVASTGHETVSTSRPSTTLRVFDGGARRGSGSSAR